MKIGRKDLAEAVRDAVHAKLSSADADRAVAAVFDRIAAALRAGDDIGIFKFGVLVNSEKRAHAWKHPATGKMIAVAAHRIIKFRASRWLLHKR